MAANATDLRDLDLIAPGSSVIVEGEVAGSSVDVDVIAAYDNKYNWSYDVSEYGPLVVVVPSKILAWQAAGWAGRESFQRSGTWKFSD